jgi:hypothetical protein
MVRRRRMTAQVEIVKPLAELRDALLDAIR